MAEREKKENWNKGKANKKRGEEKERRKKEDEEEKYRIQPRKDGEGVREQRKHT